jgi:hypothetical protein
MLYNFSTTCSWSLLPLLSESFFSMLQNYSGAAWQSLGTIKCHLGKKYLSYDTIEGCNGGRLGLPRGARDVSRAG